ncbi:TPA: hypothetical protein KAB41_004396 [Escherichia coli]|nr:hypothetical protein [Escherichia coli]
MNVQSKKSKIEHELIFSCRFDDGRKPLDIETMIKRAFKDKIGVVCRDLMPDGFTETLPPDVLLPLLNEVKSICKALS